MKNSLFSMMSAVCILLAASTHVSAMMMGEMKDDKGKGMSMMEGMMKGMADRDMPEHFLRMIGMLELSDDQKKEIRGIRFTWDKDRIRKKAEIDIAGIELKEIIAGDPVDLKKAEQKIRELATLKGDLEIMTIRVREQIKARLTPEQVSLMKKYMENHEKRGLGEAEHGMMGKEKEGAGEGSGEKKEGAAKESHNH